MYVVSCNLHVYVNTCMYIYLTTKLIRVGLCGFCVYVCVYVGGNSWSSHYRLS